MYLDIFLEPHILHLKLSRINTFFVQSGYRYTRREFVKPLFPFHNQ